MGSRRKLWSGDLSSSPSYPGHSLQKIKLTCPALLIQILGSVKETPRGLISCVSLYLLDSRVYFYFSGLPKEAADHPQALTVRGECYSYWGRDCGLL